MFAAVDGHVFTGGMNDVIEKLVAELRRARLAKQLTQEDLAEHMSVSVETISNFERGVTTPSLRTLLALAATLEINLAHVFGSARASRKISPERVRREQKLQHVIVSLDDRQLKLVVDLALAVARAEKSKT